MNLALQVERRELALDHVAIVGIGDRLELCSHQLGVLRALRAVAPARRA